MAFENIDVNKARSCLNECLNNLNTDDMKNINNNLKSSNIWECKSQKNFCNSLSKLETEYFQKLRNDIKHYLETINLIENYQNLQKENKSYITQNAILQSKLFKMEVYDVKTTNMIVQQRVRKVKDNNISNQMSNLQSKINSNTQKMNSLENQIKSSI